MSRRVLLAALMLVLAAARGDAAPCDGPLEAIRTAVLHLSAELRRADGSEGRIGFDPRVVEERTVTHPAYASPVPAYEPRRERSVADAAALLERLPAVPLRLDGARVCAGPSPRSCRLEGVGAVFAASTPRMTGDTAEVVLMATWMSDLAKQPVQAGTFRVRLVRREGQWRVREVNTLSIT